MTGTDSSLSEHKHLFAIVADVGGTHIRFGTLSGPNARLQCVDDFACAEFEQLDGAIDHYLSLLVRKQFATDRIQIICLALPGDVQSDPVKLVNAPWNAHIDRLSARYQCRVLVLNDFSAQAYAIPGFTAQELQWLRPESGSSEGLNRAIIGPGTGLGVAALLPGGEVVESEGGHISFAPQTPEQQQLLTTLWQLYPRISAERLISGPGLATLYQGVALMAGKNTRLQPEQVTARALTGDPLCLTTVEFFTQIFGSVCGDLALSFGAKGGVYLSGGLLPGLGDLFDSACFLENFENKGRYRSYCQQIPIARVLSPQPGLTGAARFAELYARTTG